MSFILDALKKSEAERQRQVGPTLLEVRVTAPRRRLPLWVLVVGALLALNVVLLLVFVLRRPAPASERDAASAAANPSASASAAVTAPPSAPPLAAPSNPPPPAPAAVSAAPALTDGADVAALPAAGGPVANGSAEETDNPADNEPAVAPTRGGSKAAKPAAAASDNYASLPSFSEIGGNLPDLRLDLHVYAERPADRYALVNMHKVREGDVLPEGPRVIAITHEGVAMNYRGQEFMLRPQ